jgi:hypothetical protein
MPTIPQTNPNPFVISQRATAMFDRFTPAPPPPEPTPPAAVTAAGEVAVTARLESTVEGLCPYCNGSMRKTIAAEQPVWICDSDRHVVPVRNS